MSELGYFNCDMTVMLRCPYSKVRPYNVLQEKVLLIVTTNNVMRLRLWGLLINYHLQIYSLFALAQPCNC